MVLHLTRANQRQSMPRRAKFLCAGVRPSSVLPTGIGRSTGFALEPAAGFSQQIRGGVANLLKTVANITPELQEVLRT